MDRFSDKPAVYTLKKEHVDISLVNGKIQIESQTDLEKLLKMDKGDSWADEYIFYNTFVEISDIKAELLIPYKKKFKSHPPTNILMQDQYSATSFFDDGKIQKIVFPKYTRNSIVKLSYKEKLTNPELFGIYFFSSHVPVSHSEYSISFPEEIQIKFKLYNDEKHEVHFSESKKKKIITYTWTADNVLSHRSEYRDFPINYFEPHLLLSIKSVQGIVFLDTYKDLYKNYNKLIGNLYPAIDPVFKTVVDSLCKNKNTEIEKLESIYYFVQSKIQYIAIEGGNAGFIPEKPLAVLNRRFGDCKGKANLLVTLLRQANIKAWLTWVGSRRRPYKYTDFPSVYADDHMIVTVQIEGKDYSLDATEMFLHYSYPSAFTQGKESLVGVDSTYCRIFEIPVISHDKNLFADELTLNVNHDTLAGYGVASLTGYYKNDFTVALIRHTEDKNTDTYKHWLCKKLDKAKLDTAYSVNLENRLDTLHVNYKIIIPGYVRSYDDHIYVNLNIEKKYQNKSIDTSTFIYHQYLNYAYTEKLNYKLMVPPGFKIESVPANSSIKHDNFGFSIHYENHETYIKMIEELYVTKPYVDLHDFQKWNQMIKDISKIYSQTLSLKRIQNESKK